MEYKVNINGIDIVADYDEDNIDNIFIPLLHNLEQLYKKNNKRVLVYIVAPPGAGKSTLASFLEYLSKQIIPNTKLQAIGMDGFHKRQEYLLTYTTIIDNKEIPLVNIKGAPITFDLDSLTNKIKQLKEKDICMWPIYDRLLHNPIEDSIKVDSDIVILEGNYLLLNIDNWNKLSEYADYTISISADENLLRDRLIERKMMTGVSLDKTIEFVDFSDMANVRLCLNNSKKADLQLAIDKLNNKYTINCV